MKQEDKDLLLRYMSMALPYGVVIKIDSDGGMLDASYNMKLDAELLADLLHFEDDFKPFLRPMSSMTEEEEKKYSLLCFDVSYYDEDTPKCSFELIKWLLEKHFDFMGLIPKGIAIEVTEEHNPYKLTEE